MDEVRCPMCGKVNPADFDVCQFCQARLRPIWGPDAAQASEPPAGDADLPDWLRALGGAGEAQTPAGSSEGSDWSDASSESQENQEDFSLDAGDWLSRIGAAEGQPPVASTPTLTAPEDSKDSFDWRPTADDDLPAWLQSMEGEQPERLKDKDAAARPPVGREDAELPAWLTGVDQDAEAETIGESFDEAEAEPLHLDSELPDWLGALNLESETDADQPIETQPPSDLPNWLAGLNADPRFTEAEPSEADSEAFEPASPVRLPEWLEETLPVETEISPSGEPDVETSLSAGSEEKNLPEVEVPGFEEKFSVQSESTPAEAEASEWLVTKPPPGRSAAPEDEMAAWLASLETEDVSIGDVILSEAETEAEGDLGWLDDLEAAHGGLNLESDAAPDALTIEPTFEDEPSAPIDLPAWLIGTAALAQASESESPVEPGEDLGMAELPSWLQAMRPVGAADYPPEAGAAGSSEQVEGAGPLAGLRGVLPAEPDITRIEKQSADVVRLQVSDQQEAQVRLLAELIGAEALTPPTVERPKAASGTALRLVVALLLVISLLAAMLVGQPVYDLPLPTTEVLGAIQLVESQPTGAPVLVAVDYEPGFSPELDPLARSVLVHMLQRGLVPVLVSSTPTGPMQIERLLDGLAAADGQQAASGLTYVNLGYIPGGAMGLANFATAPRSTYALDSQGESGWNAAALQTVDSLDDFALVVVVTESQERARSWIEQTRAYIGDRPLMMLTSTQVEPLVRPYYDANPASVAALVTGTSGATAYEINTGQVAAANRLWSPFNFGLLLSATLMVLGGMVSLVGTRLGARREKRTSMSEPGRNE